MPETTAEQPKSKKPLDIAREYFPDLDDRQLTDLIWHFTGFPHWWNIPKDGATPEECFRKQLAVLRDDPTEFERQDREMDEILNRVRTATPITPEEEAHALGHYGSRAEDRQSPVDGRAGDEPERVPSVPPVP